MKWNYINRLFLGVMLAFLTSMWLPKSTSALTIPFDGNWYGTTDQDHAMSFIVSSSGTKWTQFSLQFSFAPCPELSGGMFAVVVSGPGSITDSYFSFSNNDFGFSFTGRFATESTASGTYSFTDFPVLGCSNHLTQSGTWTAQVFMFVDVPSDYWASEYIERLYKAGLTGGCNTTHLMYCPETTVTRAQMAVFLLRGIHGSSYSPPDVGGDTGFLDIPTNHWAAAWIKELAAEGITSGCGNGNYCPETPVTRDQAAIFLLRGEHGSSYGPPAVGSGTGFGDVQVDHWAAAWIKHLVTEGITAGCGNGNYCPGTQVSRAQMAVFLVRTFGLP